MRLKSLGCALFNYNPWEPLVDDVSLRLDIASHRQHCTNGPSSSLFAFSFSRSCQVSLRSETAGTDSPAHLGHALVCLPPQMAEDSSFIWLRPATDMEASFNCANKKRVYVTVYGLTLRSTVPLTEGHIKQALLHTFRYVVTSFCISFGATTYVSSFTSHNEAPLYVSGY